MDAMLENVFSLSFKGDRNYLHGPDIAGALLTWLTGPAGLGETRDFDFSFHRMATHQLRVVVNGAVAADDPALTGVCNFTANGKRLKAYLLETPIAVVNRVPYRESDVLDRMAFDLDARRVAVTDRGGYPDLDLWVAMTKALHQRVFLHVQGKWLFVRSKIPAYARNLPGRELGLTLAANFNDKMTRSEAQIDGVKVAEIYFSVV